MNERVLVVRVVLKVGDKVLLLRRGKGERWSPGKFELPGGKVALETEKLPEAVRREVAEETGFSLRQDPKVFHVTSEQWEGRHYIIAAYFLALPKEIGINLSKEHDTFVWMPMREIQQIDTTSHTKEILMALTQSTLTSVNPASLIYNDAKETSNNELIIYADGGSRGNPGPSASGYVIMDVNETVLEEGGEYLGLTTNNQAEYQAVKLALEKAAKYHAQIITFRIDSELVVKQMNGQYQIRNRDLWPVHAHIKELTAAYKKVTFTHVRREHNKLADAKVNEILNSHT